PCLLLGGGAGGSLARLLLGLLSGLVFLALVFLGPLLLFLLRAQALLLAPLGLEALLLLASLAVELGLLFLRLLLEHVALDVGALAAHFHVDGARAPLCAGQPELRLRLAFQRDAARRPKRVLAVAAP